MAETHYFPEDKVHYVWDNELDPALTVAPGDTVVYRTREVSDGQISPSSTTEDLAGLDWERLYPLAGPVAVEGAEPGDAVEVEVLDIHTEGWGWAAVLPGFGLLEEDFSEAYLKVFDLSPGDYTLFKDNIAIPIEPFFGTMGVSPVGSEKPLIMPPGPFGGNMDTRHLVKGSRILLPVQVSGALFSVGDAHAAQGDGEVCVTVIECPMYAALRFDLHKGRNLPAPQYATPGPLTPRVEGGGWYATMGVNEDLMQAAKDSLRAMVEHISTTYHIEPVEAYVLASLVVDVKITRSWTGRTGSSRPTSRSPSSGRSAQQRPASAENDHLKHVVLLGDSIFDNAAYTGGALDVVRQVRRRLPDGWRATLGP